MNLHIVIRTHDGQNIHGNKPRYINVPKKDLIIGCLTSLIHSTNKVKDHIIRFTILDDHSTDEFLNSLHTIFSYSNHHWDIIHLKKKGFNHSGYMQFLTCKNSDADLVYSVEDDYLHQENAISEMLSSYQYLKSKYNIQKEICLFPFDNPEDYVPHQLYPGRVFRTPVRHWREGIWTTFTMMTTPTVFREFWSTFEKLALQYKPFALGEDPKNLVDEGNTIAEIWKNKVIRINPIPSLALHIQFEEQRDPFINHLEWWNKYSKINKFEVNYG
tara:strand:- start:37 stop:852 length:816 start_codon:yes stop_codon:yes gene_type:complete